MKYLTAKDAKSAKGNAFFTTKHTKHTKEGTSGSYLLGFGVVRVFRGKSARISLALLASLAVAFSKPETPLRLAC
jgi:hypothetical protein